MKSFLIFCIALCALGVSTAIVVGGLTAPRAFPVPYTLTIERGQTLFSVSEELFSDRVIRSKRVFEILMLTMGNEKSVSHGEYYFEKPVSVVEVALRISGRDFGIERTRVTFPEGFTVAQMSTRLGNELHNFDTALFKTQATPFEGYLFPDTYIFFPWTTPEHVLQTLRDTFTRKIAPLEKEIEQSGRSLEEIVIMASLIEKEARGPEDRYIISGILWKRIENGMPLQVDAPFLYIIGKESSELTRTDLALDSPFNTYKYKGLPPAPIGNPGIGSLQAALRPKDSPYLYYLHADDGTVYYGKTYAEHLQNIKKYLR